MPDPLQSVKPGEVSPFVTKTATVNTVLDIVRNSRNARRGHAGLPGALTTDPLVPALEVYVKNDTGGTLLERCVVKISTPIVSAIDHPILFQDQPVFSATVPGAVDDIIAITQKPIAFGKIGKAVIVGECVVDLNVIDAAHTHAAPSAGVILTLQTGDSGPAKIIWKDAGTGTKRAVVLLLGDGEPSSSSWKNPARVATTQFGILSTAYVTGQVVDDVILVKGDRILLKNNGAANGIRIVQDSGIPPRASDADTGDKLLGAVVKVEEGTINGNTIWENATIAPIVIDSTLTVWDLVWRDKFFARLTATDGTNWSAQGLMLDPTGVYVDDPANVVDNTAVPLTIDGTNFAAEPKIGMRVWMLRSKKYNNFGKPQYEFLPVDPKPLHAGCGLTYDPATNTFAFDYAEVAGDNTNTSLIVAAGEGEGACDTLAVDLVPTDTTTELLVNRSWITLTGGKLRQNETRTRYTNYFNAAGMLINRTASPPVDDYTEVDLCNSYDCCSATTLVVSVSVTGPGESDCIFTFNSSVTGGTAPFTYAWDFGDGGSSTAEDPVHNYIAAGSYAVSLIVRDACGQEARWSGTVTCVVPIVPDPPGPYCEHYTVTGFGGSPITLERHLITGDRVLWIDPSSDLTTAMGLIRNGDGTWALLWRSGDLQCQWTPTEPGVWDGSNCMTFGNLHEHGHTSCPSTVQICCGGGGTVDSPCCMDYPSPAELYWTWSGGTGDYAGLNGQTVTLVYSATSVGCNGTSYDGWSGEFEYAGRRYFIVLGCVGGTWMILGGSCDASCPLSAAIDSSSCNPILISGTGATYTVPCFTSGSVNWTITETHP